MNRKSFRNFKTFWSVLQLEYFILLFRWNWIRENGFVAKNRSLLKVLLPFNLGN
ncbi:hypothetical protein X975_14081, partial [Stegodyphus mimosarum]